MGARERVHRAIESAVADADKTLSQAPHAGDHERLTILLDGWFQGLADALEELAIEIDLLRRPRPEDVSPAASAAPASRVRDPAGSREPVEAGAADAPLDEAALAEQAHASREATEAVRRENDETTEKEE